MKLSMMKTAVLMVMMILMAGCTAAAGSVEPAAVDGPALVEQDARDAQALDPSTAMPMPEVGDSIIAGESNVVVEAPQTAGGEILPPQGEAVEETTGTTDEGILETDPDMKNLDISSRDGQIAFAQQNLATKLEMPLDEVKLIDYEHKVWPDGNMGCRPKGKRFMPVEVQGYIIYLQAGEDVYAFHGGAGRLPFQCSDSPVSDQSGKEIILPPPKNSQ